MPEPIADAATPADRYAIWAVRDFRLYLVGRFIAVVGQQMLGTAVGWELYDRTHSTLVLGCVGLTQILPLVLLMLPAGHVADQADRRTIIIRMEYIAAALSVGLAVVSWRQAPVGWTFLFLAGSGVARAFLWPASTAFLPQIVPRPLFANAVTWNSGSYQLAAALGPAAGGVLIAAFRGAAIIYALNAAAALVCAVLVWMVRSRPAAPSQRQKMTVANLGAGVRFVFRTPAILGTITLDLFAVLLGGATALLPVYARDILQVGPDGLGGLQAALPIGSATMALYLAHRPPMERAGRALLLAVAGFGAATVVFGFSRSYLLSLLMMFSCGALDNISVVVRHTLVQILTPEELRGRVSAVNSLFIGASNEFGEFESGLVAHWFGPVFAVVAGGIGTILVVIATAALWPEIRRFGRLDATEP